MTNSKLTLLTKSMLLMALLFFAVACDQQGEDEAIPVDNDQPGTLIFDIDPRIDPLQSGRTASLNLDDAFLIIWIEDAQGTPYNVTFERLVAFNGKYYTPTIKLPEGDYTITNFAIGDYAQNYDIIFAVPALGSDLANMVSVTVPFDIAVTAGEQTNFNIELLSVENMGPEAFGFSRFDMALIALEMFDLGIYATSNTSGQSVLVSATVTMRFNGAQVYRKELPATVNAIPVRKDWELDDIEITIEKPGYKTFTSTEWIAELLRQSSTGLVYDVYLEEE